MDQTQNPLGTRAIGPLIAKFAVPAIISGLVSALYNIVDQIFIGQSVGLLGNGATNVAFPLVTICTGITLLLGIGSASNFSLALGRQDKETAVHIAANGIALMVICGCLLCAVVTLFLHPLLVAFGATEQNLPYAMLYTRVTALGIPFLTFGTGGSHIIRADGSPRYAMVCTMSGAILNCFLDPLFIFGFDMGITGAALATIIGQILSALLALYYYVKRFQTARWERRHFRLSAACTKAIVSLGVAACFNQIAMCIVQIAMNNTLRYYGASSVYGSDIPLACVGVITKVNVIFIAIIVGIAQGCQPIIGYNYGAKNYRRVRETYKRAVFIATAVAVLFFLCFQLFPRQITSVFGNGSEEYYQFAARYFRIYMFFTFANGLQPLTSNFFTSIGKAKLGIMISMTRQIIFLLPLILLFSFLWGIDGVMYAGPIADGAAAVLAICFVLWEMKQIRALETQQ